MAKLSKVHTPADTPESPPSPQAMAPPSDIARTQFARRLYQALVEKGWNQSDLARAADIGRDSVSQYVNAKQFPEPSTLHKIAKALGKTAEQLAPSIIERGIQDEIPTVELKQSLARPSKAWLRVNREMSFATAAKIIALIQEEDGV